jgi:hypothetical protein
MIFIPRTAGAFFINDGGETFVAYCESVHIQLSFRFFIHKITLTGLLTGL